MKEEKEQTVIDKTLLYLENYREMERYIKEAVSETSQVPDIDKYNISAERAFLQSVRECRAETVILFEHLKQALASLKEDAEAAGEGYKYDTLEAVYIKTIEGAMKAAAKDESFVVWDENGNLIGSLTDNVPEGALQTNPDGSVNTYDADGNKVGTVDAETVEKMTTFESDEDAAGQQEDAEDGGTVSNDAETTNPPSEPETGENGANTEPQEAEDEPEDKVIIPQGKMKVTVICDGSLNIRRSAAWGNENICGRAIRGQSYYVKEIHVVDGKKMVRTIGDLYLSGESEHVQFEQL